MRHSQTEENVPEVISELIEVQMQSSRFSFIITVKVKLGLNPLSLLLVGSLSSVVTLQNQTAEVCLVCVCFPSGIIVGFPADDVSSLDVRGQRWASVDSNTDRYW